MFMMKNKAIDIPFITRFTFFRKMLMDAVRSVPTNAELITKEAANKQVHSYV